MNLINLCVRCQTHNNSFQLSWFNLDCICKDCYKEESEHPLFPLAKEREREELLKGNFNFPGIFADLTWDEIKNKKI